MVRETCTRAIDQHSMLKIMRWLRHVRSYGINLHTVPRHDGKWLSQIYTVHSVLPVKNKHFCRHCHPAIMKI
jgi:hypothetical protein